MSLLKAKIRIRCVVMQQIIYSRNYQNLAQMSRFDGKFLLQTVSLEWFSKKALSSLHGDYRLVTVENVLNFVLKKKNIFAFENFVKLKVFNENLTCSQSAYD